MRRSHPLDVSETFNNQHESLLVVAHAAQQEYHLGNEVMLLACTISVLEIVGIAGPQERLQLLRVVLGRQRDLS